MTAQEDRVPVLLNMADSLLSRLDSQLGRFSGEGELHSLNTLGSVPAETELARLCILSDSIHRFTGGCFDPSMGPVIKVWGFPEADNVPDTAAVDSALAFTGWDSVVTITGDSVRIRQGSYLDFGAVAKGWAVDRTWQLLMDSGAMECLVEVGGEIRCGSVTGREWNLGVRHPRDQGLLGILTIQDGAVATSGDYECFFIEGGRRYCHLIDPLTGWPEGRAAGATVIAEDCTTADAVATAAAVAGPDIAGSFILGSVRGIITVTCDAEDNCSVSEFGEVPWQR